jgi:hypothetical protein
MTTQPLTQEAFEEMIPVRQPQAILGVVALPLAVAVTAMGLFNRAQIETLRCELFENRQATCCLFEVVQDFSQNFVYIQNSFKEMRMALFHTIVANPMLFDARLSRIKN